MVHIHQAHHLGLDYGASPARISPYHLDLGESCVKWILFALNFVMSLAGLLMCGLGVYVATAAKSYEEFFGSGSISLSYLFIGGGIMIVLVGFLGCCGAMRHSTFMLLMYFILVMVLFVVQMGGVITMLVFKDELKSQIKTAATTKLAQYGDPTKADIATGPIDVVQKGLSCCGIEKGPIEWASATAKATYWIKTHDNDAPDSCCVMVSTNCGKNEAKTYPDEAKVHTKGCEDQLYEYLSSNLLLIGGLALAVSFVELFGLCGAFMLRRAILHGY